MKSQYQVASRWQGSVMHFERTGLSGTLTLNPGQLALEVRLGFLLSGLRDTIAKAIEQKLDEEFGAVSEPAQR